MISINQMSLNTKYSRRGLTFNGATPQLPAKADRALKVESEHKPTKAVAEGKEKKSTGSKLFRDYFYFCFPKTGSGRPTVLKGLRNPIKIR